MYQALEFNLGFNMDPKEVEAWGKKQSKKSGFVASHTRLRGM
jgi:hypothetical protein